MRPMSAFSYFLRTGRRLPPSESVEHKFNPWHDPDDGRFTFVGQGRYFGRLAVSSSAASTHSAVVRAKAPAPVPKSRLVLPAAARAQQPTQATSQRSPDPNPNSATYFDDLHRALRRIEREIATIQSRLRSIPGYPDSGSTSWRASNDQAFVKAATKFNHQSGLKPGHQKYVDPLFLKAWAMVESGGSKSAFLSDPLQVNVPGDWVDEKVRIAGLIRGQKMTPTASTHAALRWLEFKGYYRDQTGKPGPWIGFERALQRYNGRKTPHSSGVPHRVWYAREVLRLYADAKKMKQKRQ